MNETLTRTLYSLLIESIEYNQPISDKQAKQASFEDFYGHLQTLQVALYVIMHLKIAYIVCIKLTRQV